MKPKKPIQHVTIFIILISITACTFFNSPQPPDLKKSDIPKHYLIDISKQGPDFFKGLEAFHDKHLTALINQAIHSNFSLMSARATYLQTKAQAQMIHALGYPQINGSFEPSISKSRVENKGTGDWTNLFSLGMMSSFEIDFWGKIRAQKKSAQFSFDAVRWDYQTAMISLISELTLCWIDIISQNIKYELLETQLATNRTYLKLIEMRFQKGMVSALDLYQQQQVVESILSQLPLIQAQKQLKINHMTLLCGATSSSKISITRNELPELDSLPVSGVPSDLLSNRPDIQASWHRLMASYQDVQVAKANQLPSLSLGASGNFQSDKMGDLFNFWLVRLTANLTGPLFDAGQRKAQTQTKKAKASGYLSQYRQTVYTAIKEVEDALVQEHYQIKHLEALKKEYQTAQKALDEARNRYNRGVSSYLPVLTHNLSVQKLERALVENEAQRIRYRVYLYRALGGKLPKELFVFQ